MHENGQECPQIVSLRFTLQSEFVFLTSVACPFVSLWQVDFYLLSDELLQSTLLEAGEWENYRGQHLQILQNKGHVIVSTEGSKLKPCVLCSFLKKKTKSGWHCYTRKKCSMCDAPLCCRDRSCFQVFHNKMLPYAERVMCKDDECCKVDHNPSHQNN